MLCVNKYIMDYTIWFNERLLPDPLLGTVSYRKESFLAENLDSARLLAREKCKNCDRSMSAVDRIILNTVNEICNACDGLGVIKFSE